ncbi:MAG: ubiquinone/menaquinone biosynthesis C-methylase UbiE [Acidimicrobiales bacterium]|jgi:ubiquinone/menaquinone biosynthesis C-methylase UbiE
MNWLGEQIVDHMDIDSTVLDLGAGVLDQFGRVAPDVQQYVAVDVFDPYLRALSGQAISTVKWDLCVTPFPFTSNSYDIVVMLDVLEHMDTSDGFKMIAEAERIASERIIIFTTEGYVKQDAHDAWGLGLNPHQEHRCGWNEETLKSMGYTREKSLEGMIIIKELH